MTGSRDDWHEHRMSSYLRDGPTPKSRRGPFRKPDLDRSELFDLARVASYVALTPVAYWLGWLAAVAFVSLLSIWALVESAWAAFRGGDARRLREIDDRLDRIEKLLKARDR